MNKVHLPISVNYVSHWGFWEGMREILQNAIDTDSYSVKKKELAESIVICSSGGFLDLSTLMMGESSKRNDDSSIGKYGEGYKLAMLVLCRAGYSVKIFNGSEIWTASIETNPQLNCEGLCITIKENDTTRTESLQFEIQGLSEEDFEILNEKFICQEQITVRAEHFGSYCFESYANIPQVFVGGLYVCDLPSSESYWFSYNFMPNILELDRDRSAVEGFWLQLEATKLIANSGDIELLTDMAAGNAADISDYYEAPYSTESTNNGNNLQEIALNSFLSKYGDNAYPISGGFDHKKTAALTVRAVQNGLVPIIVKQSFYKMLPSEIKDLVKVEKIQGDLSKILSKYLTDNKKHMRSKAAKAMIKIIDLLEINGK